MTTPVSQTEQSPPQPKSWQFSLRRLLILVTSVAIFCGIASWSLVVAVGFGGLMCVLFVGLGSRPVTYTELFILLFVILILGGLLPALQPNGQTYSTAIIAVQVLDQHTNGPVKNAVVTVNPNGWTGRSVSGTTNGQGECRIAATFYAQPREVGWGRFKFDAVLRETQLEVSAHGYISSQFHWKKLSREEVRPADAPPNEPVVISLQPKPTP